MRFARPSLGDADPRSSGGFAVSARLPLAKVGMENPSGRACPRDHDAHRMSDHLVQLAGDACALVGEVIVSSIGSMACEAGRGQAAAVADPERARSAALAIESTGRDAPAELRGLLGVLRGDEEVARAPVQSPREREVAA